MNKLTLLFSLLLLLSLSACKKKKTPIRTYSVTLDMRPSVNDGAGVPVYLDPAKKPFLSLSAGTTYNVADAQSNASLIDVVVYDGTTTSTSIGDIHFISPGGGTLSLKALPSAYLYLQPGSSNVGIPYYELTQMNNWLVHNTTKIRDESGLNGLTASEFDALDNLEDYNKIVEKINTPGTNNSNQAKKLLQTSTNTLSSGLWFFEFQSGNSAKTAIAQVTDFRYLPDGFVTLTIKMPE